MLSSAFAEGSHSGLVRPPAKRVGGVEPPRGFESRTLRHITRSNRKEVTKPIEKRTNHDEHTLFEELETVQSLQGNDNRQT